MTIVTLENVCKTYKDTLIIDDLNLEINNHEFTVFIGPSGCGKSTLLRLISGLDTVSSGKIYFNHKDITDLSPDKRHISMVFQDYALYPHMSVYDNIAFGLMIAKIPKNLIKQKVNQVAKMIDIETLLNRKPSELSGGQRQRVAMGRALVRDTDLMLMDEPLSNLDSKLRTHMRGELTLLKQKIQKNIIYVTHDQIEAMTLADKIAVLYNGRIQQYDAPKILYETPANRFVAEFLGTPKMNIIKAELHYTDCNIFLKGQDFQILLSKDHADLLKNYSNSTIFVGIRPHDLHISKQKNHDSYFQCNLQFKEYIGSNCMMTALCGIHTIQCDIPNDVDNETQFILTCDTNKLHFFDIKTENRIVA